MLGIIIYLYFLFLGYIYSSHVFNDKNIYFRAWMGGIFGNAILMMGIVLPSSIAGFNYISHIILIVLAALPVGYILKKHGADHIKKSIGKGKADGSMDAKVFFALVVPITIVIAVLMTNHILAPSQGGGYAAGQSTFGDLQMHLGFVTSIAEQGKFAPEYVFLSGYKMNYPFFVDMLSSSLYLFGTSLRWAVLIPSYVMAMLLVMGFYFTAYKLTSKRAAAVLATVFFFLGGGFGFAYFFEGAKADHTAFTKIFTDYYHTPTNFNENNIRWANPICDMIIPQRTTMAGWCMILPCLWLLVDAVKTKSRKDYITIGLLAGCMPMIHTHSFLALGMICAVVFFMYIADETRNTPKGDIKGYVTNWLIFGGIVAVMAAPQLFYWTFRQTSGNESFLKLQFNWVNHNDPYFWFYLKNWGIVALFGIPAIMKADKDNSRLLCGCAFIFITAEIVLFQPNEYDNNKLFFIVYMILLILVSDWLIYIWEKLKGAPGIIYLAVVVILAGTVSGVLTIGREYHSGGMYETFSKDKVAMGEYIKENTSKDALFLTSSAHLNPVPTLAGRNIYLGSSLYVYFHGMGDEYYKRDSAIKAAYSGTYEELETFCDQNGIDYIYIGDNERNSFDINENTVSKLEKVYTQGTESLYKIK